MNAALLNIISRTCEADIGYGTSEQEVVSTGILQLDAATGGIPKGRIVEIFGADGSGKTALALHLAQRLGGPILYADADCGLSPYIANGRDLYLLDVGTLEATLEACRTAAIGGFKAIVIDTVTALPTLEDTRLSINEKKCPLRDLQAKVLSKCLPVLVSLLRATGCTLILVNQLREKPGAFCGRPDHPTGGKAVGYYAALRLETNRTGLIEAADGETIGQNVLVRVQKCKYAAPGKRAEIRLIYGEGLVSARKTVSTRIRKDNIYHGQEIY